PMPLSSFFRLFLVLALLCNGLASAHAAVAHALMALPVQETVAMEDCHDRAGHHEEGSVPAPSDHGKASTCCQGPVCNCACAVSLPANLPALVSPAFWPSQPVLSAPDRYRSIAADLVLRPPIA
ncbi:MAG TPA: CopL family metal-binding regulatory protein, partial [Moraxellaceae bacterium]